MSRPVGSVNKDKLYKVLQVKIREDQANFLNECCFSLGVTQSEFVRMLINVQMKGWKNNDAEETKYDQLQHEGLS